MKYIKRILFILGALLAALFFGKKALNKALKKTISVDLDTIEEKEIIEESDKAITQLANDTKIALQKVNINIKKTKAIKKKLELDLKKVEATESTKELNSWLNRPE